MAADRRVRTLVASVGVVVALGSSCSPTVPPSSVVHPTPTAATKRAAASEGTTWLGPDGVQSSAVILENQRAGSTGWRITRQGNGFIEGFANTTYAAAGGSVKVYASTDARTFRIAAYRMGWYRGSGGRLVWSSPPITGIHQPGCRLATATNMVSCDNWGRPTTIRVTAAFVPGDYLLKLTGSGNQQSYVLLTVWDPASRATYLVMNRLLVEEGWNAFGGYSYYQGVGRCIIDSNPYPPCNRARVVSFDRPFADDGSSDFLTNEYPMVQYMEQEGLDVTYCTDVCISEHPNFLLQHKVLVGLDHDETWTDSEREAAIRAAAAGVNMAFFGAATLVRHARLQPSPLGPDREEVDYRDSAEDPLDRGGSPWQVTGNSWSSPPTSWDAESFLGEIYSGYLTGTPPAPMKVFDAGSWLFRGTGLGDGADIPSVINSDIDHLDPAGPMPRNLQVLAHSPISLDHAYTNQGKWGGYTYSDATYYTESPSGAGVFDSGDNIWVATLQPCPPAVRDCPAPVMRRLTANILLLFGQGPAGRLAPSQPNWRSVTPAGS